MPTRMVLSQWAQWEGEGVGTGVMRWEEPHHPGPGLQLERHSNPLSPTLQHDPILQPHLHPTPGGLSDFSGSMSHISSDTPVEAPDDANDLRGFHFRRLLGKPL